MQLYGHRRFVVEAKEVEEDSVVETISGDIPVKKGEFLLKDLDGNVFPLTETRFKEYYVPIERVEKKQRKTFKEMSPFEQQEIENMYKQSWIEDENYISNKPL